MSVREIAIFMLGIWVGNVGVLFYFWLNWEIGPRKDLHIWQFGRLTIGLFPYWIGFSFRYPEPYRTIDLGYIKFMWT